MAVTPAQPDRAAPDAAQARLVVVKVGSGVIAPGGSLDRSTLQSIASQIARARAAGSRVAIVSSGAVACGMPALGLTAMPTRIVEKQAAAAIGQAILIRAWDEALDPARTSVAQVLLTAADLDDRARFLNARHTLETLLARGIVPIINENDSVALDEIRFGDNDRLSALAAMCIGAGHLVILSVAPGLTDAAGTVIPSVTDIPAARAHVRHEHSGTGIGGMSTKLDAAELATSAGIRVTIAPGREPAALSRVLADERLGTDFPPRTPAAPGRKRWLGATTHPAGTITIDAGAAAALTDRGASLLPKGITAVAGPFARGAPVRIATAAGNEIARGLAAYSSDELRAIMGKHANDIEGVLGYAYCDEAVHRDDLVLTSALQ